MQPRRLLKDSPAFWSVHSHSRYSKDDALCKVSDMVDAAVSMNYPALGLTDHGNMVGSVQLYTECRKAGIEPLPGIEAYVRIDDAVNPRKVNHLTINAYTPVGYRNLARLATLANQRFHYKPVLDFGDLAGLAADGHTEGIMVSTGCFFGLVQVALREHGYGAALAITKTLAGWFPKVYVELQHHGVHQADHDADRQIKLLVDLADEVGLPYIVTSDSHYIKASDRKLHDGLKRMVSWSEDVDDAVFPGIGSYHMPDAAYLSRFIEPAILHTALDNLHELAQEACVRIPELEKFQLRCPDITYGGDPDLVLSELVDEHWARSEHWGDQREAEQLAVELDVIKKAGMAGYILLVADVARFMVEKDIWFHARGSASGSLVCRVLGITQIDPMAWNLRFERFMSTDRTRPPDIDLDVDARRRNEVTDYLRTKYHVRQITSHRTYSIKGDEEDEESVRGSLMVRYGQLSSKRGIAHRSWAQIPGEDQALLSALGSMELFSGYNTNPAGYVITENAEEIDELPLTWIASSKTLLSTYDKKDVEALGFVKLDVMQLPALAAHRIACEIAGVDNKTIPMNDKEVFKRISGGNTEGIFQLKGYAMKKGCESIKPKNMADLAAAQALFRPAAMNSGATLDYRLRRTKREPIPTQHGDIMIECKDTYGVLLYQEQVVGVLRRMDMPAEELTEMLVAIKSSGKRGMASARAMIESKMVRVEQLARARGWNETDIAWLENALVAYIDYGFNLAHAATYAEVAYRCAWMAVHHPVAFWTGQLEIAAGTVDEAKLVSAARRNGLRITAPHVNRSRVGYTPDVERNTIRRGLISVKGVGQKAAAELAANAPYKSLLDLGRRSTPKIVTGSKHLALGKDPLIAGGVITALFDAGALDGVPDNHEESE